VKPDEILSAAVLQQLSYIAAHTSQTAERLATGVMNSVLETGTRVLDTTGMTGLSWQSTCGALEVRNNSNTVVVVSAGTPGVAPIQGAGVSYVEPYSWRVVNVCSRTVAIYGAAGARIGYQAFTTGLPPMGGTIGVTAPAIGTTVGTDPAAGAEASVTVPAGTQWELYSVGITLVTSAAVANRTPHLLVDDGTNVVANLVPAAVQAASATVAYSFTEAGVDYAAVRDGVMLVGQLPTGLRLGPGWRIRTLTTALDVGDNYGAPVVAYRSTVL
jgi:hypothetical protein